MISARQRTRGAVVFFIVVGSASTTSESSRRRRCRRPEQPVVDVDSPTTPLLFLFLAPSPPVAVAVLSAADDDEVDVSEGRSARKKALFKPFIFNGRLIFILFMSVVLALAGSGFPVTTTPPSSALSGRWAFLPASIIAGSASMMLGLRDFDDAIMAGVWTFV